MYCCAPGLCFFQILRSTFSVAATNRIPAMSVTRCDLQVCAIAPVVRNASFLYKLSTRVLGHTLPDSVIRASFFKHFCGGETEGDLVPVMERLSANGVGAILDYAAEADVDEGSAPRGDHSEHPETLSEMACDANAAIVLTAIDAASSVAERNPNSKVPFAACKMTGIGKPELLERISTVLVSLRGSFNELDTDGNGRLTAAEFVDGLFKAGTTLEASELAKIFADLDLDADGELDYYDWLARLDPSDASTNAIFTGSFTPLDEPGNTTPSPTHVALQRFSVQVASLRACPVFCALQERSDVLLPLNSDVKNKLPSVHKVGGRVMGPTYQEGASRVQPHACPC